MYRILPFISFLLITVFGFSQNILSDEEQILNSENEILQLAVQDENKRSADYTLTNFSNTIVLVVDLDDDGMEDSWETSNGLDPNDPKDAWTDEDNDQILNLFEFQLETDPNDSSSPSVIEVSPSEASSLDDLIEEAENGIQVIRLSTGNYNTNVLAVYDYNFKLMIQGGWNDDFSFYDPNKYPTYWNGADDETLNVLVPENDDVTNTTVVLDGVNFISSDNFILGGTVGLRFNDGYSAISIYNCSFNFNAHYGLSLGHKGSGDAAEIFIVNTVIGNNGVGGIYTQVTNNALPRWRLINTTINNPNSEEGGIDGLTSTGELRIELTNSINWGNTDYSFNFSTFHNVIIPIVNSNVDEAAPGLDITTTNTISDDPLFEAPMSADWTLTDNSPCIDAGIDVGLPFTGIAPDMGAFETIDLSGITEKNLIELLSISPNPFYDNFSIQIDEAIFGEAEVKIYDLLGKCFLSEKRMISGQFEMKANTLPHGFYMLSLEINGRKYISKILKN